MRTTSVPERYCSEQVFAQLVRAESFYEAGQLVEASECYLQAIQLDSTQAARLEFGAFLLQIDCPVAATEQFTKVLKFARDQQNENLRSVACNNLAVACRQSGDFKLAEMYQQQSMTAAHNCIGLRNVGITSTVDLGNLANEAIRNGDYKRARQLLTRSLSLEADAQSLSGQASDLGSLGVVALLQGDCEAALEYLWRAHRLHRRLQDHRNVGADLINLAEAYRLLGCFQEALRCLRLATVRFERAHAFQMLQKVKELQVVIERVIAVSERNPLLN